MSRKWIVLAVLVVVAIAAVGYVGHAYFDNFNNFGANPKCVSDCWENGKRVR